MDNTFFDARIRAMGSGDELVDAVAPEAAALLDPDELIYFKLNQVEGRTRAKCAVILGWPMAKVDRVRRRLNLHLAKLRRDSAPLPAIVGEPVSCDEGGADLERHEGRFRATSPTRIYSFARGGSLNPFFRQKLSNGFSAWTLCPSNQSHFPNLPIVEAPIKEKIMDLSQTLKDEQQKLTRIGERLHAGRLALDAGEREVREARAELAAEMADSVLGDRDPAPGPFEKRITKIEASLTTMRTAVTGAESAHRQQVEKIQGIEAEIVAKREETFLVTSRNDRAEIRAMIEKLSEQMIAYHASTVSAGVANNYDLCYRTIFPVADRHSWAGQQYRELALSVGFAAQRLYLERWERDGGHILAGVA